MRTPLIDGQSIGQFIPANLRHMFYQNAVPEYKYAIHNGLDPYGFSIDGLKMYLPLWALQESSFKSVDAFGNVCEVTGALWHPQGRTFDGDDDIALTNLLSTISSDTSGTIILTWNPDDSTPAAFEALFTVSDTDGDSYFQMLMFQTTGVFYTSARSAADNKWVAETDANPFTSGETTVCGLTHNGTVPAVYIDGVAVAQTVAGTDKTIWVSGIAGADNIYIGTRYTGSAKGIYINGSVSELWYYNRVFSAGEMLEHSNRIKWRYS